MTRSLHVSFFGRHAGVLSQAGDTRAPEDWAFQYDPAYLASQQAVPLSVSLALRAEPWVGAVVRNWFANLLPEGQVRQAITERHRIPIWDDFALLAAIGGECAGAVSIMPPEGERPPADAVVSEDLATALAEHVGAAGAADLALIGTPRRLSLAGAQDKIAVVVGQDGVIRLPGLGEITTHILKPDSATIRGLREYEALGLHLAKATGLPVANATLTTVGQLRALLVERYDRARDRAGALSRLHQEDFCQALGYPSEMKYEENGGPSLAACASLIRNQLLLGPASLRAFLDWTIFNVLIGNADAHAKNLAILCDATGNRSLAPFYDLVPTITISRSMVERRPALRLGAAASIEAISASDWNTVAKAMGFGAPFVRGRVVALSRTVVSHVYDVCGVLEAQGGDARRLHRAALTIVGNAKRTSAAVERKD